MSDRHRRWICRATFVVFCLFPTLIVANWALFPRTAREWQSALQPQLGLLLRIDRVKTLTPFETVFESVQFADRNRRLLATAPRICWSHQPESHRIELAPFEIAVPELTRFWQGMISAVHSQSASTHIHVPRLTVVDRQGQRTVDLYDCHWQAQATGAGTSVRLTFNLGQGASSCEWQFGSIDGPQHEIRHWSLDSRENLLPLWLLGAAFPRLESCGPAATIRGIVRFNEEDWHTTLQFQDCVLGSIDLSSTCAQLQLAESISGTATVTIRSGQLVDDRLVQFDGHVASGSGRIDYGLVLGASRWLQLKYADLPQAPIEYRQLQLGVEIRDGRLYLNSDDATGGILWAADGQQVIAATTERSLGLPVHVLACAIAPENAYAVPANQSALDILRWLPVSDHDPAN